MKPGKPLASPEKPLRALVINLDRDLDRMEQMRRLFAPLDFVRLERSPGVLMSELPRALAVHLSGRNDVRAGMMGVFLAHVRAWETVAAGGEWTLILEDDIRMVRGGILRRLVAPKDAELIFVNSRADPEPRKKVQAARPDIRPTLDMIDRKLMPEAGQKAPGGDGYLLSPEGARKLLAAVEADGFRGHVDWRIWRYTLPQEETRVKIAGSWLEGGSGLVPPREKQALQWGVVRGYCASPWMVTPGGVPSTRITSDIEGGVTAAPDEGDSFGKRLAIGPASCPKEMGTRLVSPNDLEGEAPAEVDALPLDRAVPYCFDFARRQLILTLHDRPLDLLEEPFFYIAQRKAMQEVAYVGFDRLDEVFGTTAPAQPVMIFSLGRTGSTLLDGLIGTTMRWSLSEPDAISQLALSRLKTAALTAEERRSLYWHSLSPLMNLAGQEGCAVKLRSQVSSAAGEVARAFPEARFVFMVRERKAWARSTFRAFRLPPERVAHRLLEGIKGIAQLRAAGVDLQILRYEDVLKDPAAELRRLVGAHADRVPDFEARVAEVMGRDSQAGSVLERGKITRPPEEEADWVEKFEAHWAKVRPAEVPDGVPEYLI